ncbi:outer membrane protein [Primorskyibacter sedentarius]|uniref:Outer membrane protein n=1 Tax=Primorskyibacter sedentarius TaxID=745311 RepID=A0A4R3J511_9RHOB|nr:MipA/OmpV family protein [Primorskyibacter sedentarius]TCS59893.1 outer membrane protein [Primorskyibacter sedentarius]
MECQKDVSERILMPVRAIKSLVSVAALVTAGILAPTVSLAQDRVVGFELGLGAQFAPEYEGSDEYSVGPTGTASLNELRFGSINFSSSPDDLGLSLGPSFRYLAERDSDDFDELDGIPDNDAAVELGLKATYKWEGFQVFGQLRKGVTGHEGLVGELGADAKYEISGATSLSFGPRVGFGDDEYMDYAFGVPNSATALSAYDPDGGIRSFGAEARIRHDLGAKTAIEGRLAWERLAGDAEDSPIVEAGSRDQLRLGVMLIRKFQLRF